MSKMLRNCAKIILFFLLTSIPFSLNLKPGESEQEVMLKLKQQWGTTVSSIKKWDPAVPACKWPGIQCTRNSITGILLQNKKIHGRIPALICSLDNLTTLDLSNNIITGAFPVNLYNCSKLQKLDLSRNSFEGPLPSEIHKLSSLQYLDISQNSFTGEIPSAIRQLTNLTTLNLAYNSFNGSFPPAIGYLMNLTHLYLSNNMLIGEIPTSVDALRLVEVDFSYNKLEGAVPEDFGKLQKLEILHMEANQLSGSLPETMGRLTALKQLIIDKNNFSGDLPPELGLHSKLETIDVSLNQFSGELPKYLCAQGALAIIAASTNNFNGAIPESLAKCNTLQTLLLYNNVFSGIVPLGLWTLSNISILDLTNNRISGQLPVRFAATLEELNIAINKFSGPIPAALGYLPSLSSLDLSSNEFSGQIPPELGRLNSGSFDLSANNLTGKIPSILDTVDNELGFLNNPNLCSDNQTTSLPKCSPLHHTSKYLLVTVITGLGVLLVVLYFLLSRVTVKNHIMQPAWIMTPFHSLNFTEAQILCNLLEDNVIGSGGSGKIYRIHINDSDSKVAVKRIWNDIKFSKALEKQFLAEAEILAVIRHTNIVKLLCCISSENSKLLVYGYMENQSLDKWLHRDRRAHESSSIHSMSSRNNTEHGTALDWPTRLGIAIGAAKGLCYMHHGCYPPIIHRDVKSSNILLDSEFHAKIADFGLAKMNPNIVGEPHTASAVAGSFGYIAPEYWRTGRLNEKIDIYSFGVVLLELATGKEACEGNEHLNLADWSWQNYCEGIPIEDALDNTIKDQCFLHEMTSVFKLGLMCTNKVPSSRPLMKQVLELLILYRHHQAPDHRMQGPEWGTA